MKTIALWLALAMPATALAADTYEIDPVHTRTVFKVSHLGISEFYGMFAETTGTWSIDEANPSKSTVSLTIKAASVNTFNDKRDEHLRSPDFFNAKQFPVITFKGKKFERDGDNWKVTGDLTLHGVTREITVPFRKIGEGKDPWGGYRSGYTAEFTIKRSDYGMDFMIGGVGDEVSLIVAVEGIRK